VQVIILVNIYVFSWLILGISFFSCMTGLRISDVQRLTRSNLWMITFHWRKKTKGSIYCNEYEGKRDIVAHRQIYSLKKFTQINMLNDRLKKSWLFWKSKEITFHVARHTLQPLCCKSRRSRQKNYKYYLLQRHQSNNGLFAHCSLLMLTLLIDNLFG
jgi:integrase